MPRTNKQRRRFPAQREGCLSCRPLQTCWNQQAFKSYKKTKVAHEDKLPVGQVRQKRTLSRRKLAWWFSGFQNTDNHRPTFNAKAAANNTTQAFSLYVRVLTSSDTADAAKNKRNVGLCATEGKNRDQGWEKLRESPNLPLGGLPFLPIRGGRVGTDHVGNRKTNRPKPFKISPRGKTTRGRLKNHNGLTQCFEKPTRCREAWARTSWNRHQRTQQNLSFRMIMVFRNRTPKPPSNIDIDIDIDTLREVHPTSVSGLALQA